MAAHFAKRNTKFGIGGHKVAAGMNLKGLLQAAKKMILDELEKAMPAK